MSCSRTQHGGACRDPGPLDSESEALPLRHRAPHLKIVGYVNNAYMYFNVKPCLY